jgi:hypothetical protein
MVVEVNDNYAPSPPNDHECGVRRALRIGNWLASVTLPCGCRIVLYEDHALYVGWHDWRDGICLSEFQPARRLLGGVNDLAGPHPCGDGEGEDDVEAAVKLLRAYVALLPAVPRKA